MSTKGRHHGRTHYKEANTKSILTTVTMAPSVTDKQCEVVLVGCGAPLRGMGWYHAVQLLGGECPSAVLCYVVEPWFMGTSSRCCSSIANNIPLSLTVPTHSLQAPAPVAQAVLSLRNSKRRRRKRMASSSTSLLRNSLLSPRAASEWRSFPDAQRTTPDSSEKPLRLDAPPFTWKSPEPPL